VGGRKGRKWVVERKERWESGWLGGRKLICLGSAEKKEGWKEGRKSGRGSGWEVGWRKSSC